jgi:hypothetical protein
MWAGHGVHVRGTRDDAEFCEEMLWKVATFSVKQAVEVNMIIHMLSLIVLWFMAKCGRNRKLLTIF